MIHLHKVSKRFGQRWALREFDLHVPAGEIFGLLGHNGAGKSTAIGLMLGQVWPTEGKIQVCGSDILSHRQQALQKVGAIFETPAFYDYLSGWRNLEILSAYSAPTPEKRLREVLDWVGLSGREQSKVKTYSHGMRSRLALAQALLPGPALLILDEPSDGLDPEGIHEMRQTILRLQRELRLTILLSSHFLTEVEQTCTRIAVLKEGYKLFEGALDDIKTRDWTRLRTRDFAAAAQSLTAAQLICEAADGRLIRLQKGVASDAVVRHLVQHQFPVYEIATEEQTLEQFYLTLMHPRTG